MGVWWLGVGGSGVSWVGDESWEEVGVMVGVGWGYGVDGVWVKLGWGWV